MESNSDAKNPNHLVSFLGQPAYQDTSFYIQRIQPVIREPVSCKFDGGIMNI